MPNDQGFRLLKTRELSLGCEKTSCKAILGIILSFQDRVVRNVVILISSLDVMLPENSMQQDTNMFALKTGIMKPIDHIVFYKW